MIGRPSKYPHRLTVSVDGETLTKIRHARAALRLGPQYAKILRRLISEGLASLDEIIARRDAYRMAGAYTDESIDRLEAAGISPTEAAEMIGDATLAFLVASGRRDV